MTPDELAAKAVEVREGWDRLDRIESQIDRDLLLAILEQCENDGDQESAHYDADHALVRYLDDAEITLAYDKIGKWYA